MPCPGAETEPVSQAIYRPGLLHISCSHILWPDTNLPTLVRNVDNMQRAQILSLAWIEATRYARLHEPPCRLDQSVHLHLSHELCYNSNY